MKLFQRIIASAVACALSLTMLTACSSDGSGDSGTDPDAAYVSKFGVSSQIQKDQELDELAQECADLIPKEVKSTEVSDSTVEYIKNLIVTSGTKYDAFAGVVEVEFIGKDMIVYRDSYDNESNNATVSYVTSHVKDAEKYGVGSRTVTYKGIPIEVTITFFAL